MDTGHDMDNYVTHSQYTISAVASAVDSNYWITVVLKIPHVCVRVGTAIFSACVGPLLVLKTWITEAKILSGDRDMIRLNTDSK
jgi:hypothetical protein